MSLIHYFLFVPPTLLCSFYFGKKLECEIYKNQKKKKAPWTFWVFVFAFFLVATVTLSPIMVFLFYSCGLFFVFDLFSFIFKKLEWKEIPSFWNRIYFHGVTIYLIAILFTVFGLYNATVPTIRYVPVHLNKDTSSIKIAMITDLHLGTGTNHDSITKIVNDVNLIQADLFVMVGDIFDERTSDELRNDLYQQFRLIETTYGSYYVEGNHDLLTDEVRNSFEESDVTVLEDESLLIDSKFYLVGRLDRKEDRMELSKIVQDIDFRLPVILLNHRPDDLINARKLGIDLQLSGHTHAGQLFPANLILQHGYYQFGDFHLVVSPGYGNWGIPIRTYGRNELVVVDVD